MKLKKIDSKKFNRHELMHIQSIRKALKAEVDDFCEIFLAHQHGEEFIVLKKGSA